MGDKIGLLVINFGGFGEFGIEVVLGVFQILLKWVYERFDLVGFDFCGVVLFWLVIWCNFDVDNDWLWVELQVDYSWEGVVYIENEIK